MVNKRLEFGVLGPLEMSVDGAPVPLGAHKQRAVLAMLVMNRNQPVSVDKLIAALWEGQPPSGARASIHTYVSHLRKLLSGVGIDPRAVLSAAPPGYRLSTPDNTCDHGRFVAEKIAGVHAAAADRFDDASRHLSAALAEWRGPVLEDLRDFQFVDAYATSLVQDKLLVNTAKAEADIACGRALAVITELEALVAEHPDCEPLWAQLITAYYITERQSEALSAYRRVKRVLADELGIDPGQTLRALNERILRQEPLDVKKSAKAAAADAETVLDRRSDEKAVAYLHEASAGRSYPLQSAKTRIGRLHDNDIVLGGDNVSRRHAVIEDTGTNYVINDLQSSNGVHVQYQRIRSAATLNDGDHIRIGDHEFTFQIAEETVVRD
jgi:DNA-binding SARP family transcriptional activator